MFASSILFEQELKIAEPAIRPVAIMAKNIFFIIIFFAPKSPEGDFEEFLSQL
jgi:hypothetical protein